MTYGIVPTYSGAVPSEGPKAVPVVIDFTGGTNQVVDLQPLLQVAQISNIQTIYVDNFSNNGDVTLTTEISNQGITFPANTCGYYPILVTTNLTFRFFCANPTKIRVHFLNYPVAASVWPQGGDYPDPPPSNGVYYVFRNGVWIANPIQTDAPSDGNRYARLNGTWSAINGIYVPLSGTITSSPVTGTIYIDQNLSSPANVAAIWGYANGSGAAIWRYGTSATNYNWSQYFPSDLSVELRRYVSGTYIDNVWQCVNATGQATFNLYGATGPNITGISATTGALRVGGGNLYLWSTTGFYPNSPSVRFLGISAAPWARVYSNAYYVSEGANANQGVATLVAGTVVVNNTSVTANSRIQLTIQDPNGGTPGAVYISARTPGTSFTITSTSGTDTSIVAYTIFEPA